MFSLFDNLYPGADAAISGIVTLLAAAQALAYPSHTEPMDKPIMYSFFNGVSFKVVLFFYIVTMAYWNEFLKLSGSRKLTGRLANLFS